MSTLLLSLTLVLALAAVAQIAVGLQKICIGVIYDYDIYKTFIGFRHEIEMGV